MTSPILTSVVGFSMTMADDSEHRLIDFDLPFYECNIHVYDNAAKYGALGVCEAEVNAGDVIWFNKANLKDFVFKNKAAGSNTKIVAIATIPTEQFKTLLQ